MPAERTRRPNSVASSLASDHPVASKDVTQQLCQNPPSKAMSQESLVPQLQKRPYCTEIFRLWKNARWYQIPLSSLRRPKAGLFSHMFQASLQAYQQLRKSKRLKVGRPFSVLPLPDLPAVLTDCPQKICKQPDRPRHSRARGAKRRKSLSRRKGPLVCVRRMPARACKRRASAPETYVTCSGTAHQRKEEEPSSTSREEEQQLNLGCSEWQVLELDSRRLSRVSLPECSLAEVAEDGRNTSAWASGCSPLREEEDADMDMFPPDWTPPRIEFLYYKDLPVLSPAPGLASKSQSSGEMPDITEEPMELQVMECTAEPTSSTSNVFSMGDNLLSLKVAAVLQSRSIWEIGSGDGAGLEHSAPLVCGAANKQQEGGLLADPKGESQSASDLGQSPLSSPIPPQTASSTVCCRSSISSSDKFEGDTESLALELDEVAGPERPQLPSPTPPLMTSSRTSSRCSISASSDELSGDPGSLALDLDMEEDVSDRDLVPLSDLFEMSSVTSQSIVELNEGLCSGSDSYLSNLDKLLEEKREQTWGDRELERSLGQNLLLSKSFDSKEATDGSIETFPEAHRLLLEQFSISQGTIPDVHPGESIFLPSPSQRTAPSLDTAGLNPQNILESLFFRSHVAQQMAFLQDGFLGSLYLGRPHCPHPVLRWLFQLMSFNVEVSADAFRALWEMNARQLASANEASTDAWCPALQDITQAFYNLGACESALNPAGLLPLEFGHKDLQCSEHPLGSAGMKSESLRQAPYQHTLAVMLGDIFKFLTLCVASRPCCYPDRQCLALLVLLCRLSLDRNLRKQPQMELQQLLLVLLEVIQDWQEELPELCRFLCHVSQHHHNLVAIVRLFPDTTVRGRHLRRNLSLCFIAKLLGKMQMVTGPWQEEMQLQQLVHLLPLMKPSILSQNLQRVQSLQGQPEKEQQKVLPELDEQACYLCYSLLTLANVVVVTNPGSSTEQEHLQQLCIQLQQHISTSIREDPRLMYRTELKDLAAQTYVKWQELLPRTWLQGMPQQMKQILARLPFSHLVLTSLATLHLPALAQGKTSERASSWNPDGMSPRRRTARSPGRQSGGGRDSSGPPPSPVPPSFLILSKGNLLLSFLTFSFSKKQSSHKGKAKKGLLLFRQPHAFKKRAFKAQKRKERQSLGKEYPLLPVLRRPK